MSILKKHWHFLLVVVFFAVNGYAQYVGLISVWNLLGLLLFLAAFSLLLFWLGKLFFRSSEKSALFTTFFLVIVLFFGVIEEFLAKFPATAYLSQLKILVPLCAVLFTLVMIILKRSKKDFPKTRFFLNLLFMIYIVVDAGIIIYKLIVAPAAKQNETIMQGLELSKDAAIKKPSVYFIVLDAYSGSSILKKQFNYDNRRFEAFLEHEQFKVNRLTTSNYLFTIYSLASTLNMDYIPGLGKQSATNHFAYRRASRMIANNAVTRFFRKNGYEINNYSYFHLEGEPVIFKSDYLPAEVSLITHKTMYSRIINNAVNTLPNMFSMQFLRDKYTEFYVRNNEGMMDRVLKDAREQEKSPSFTYMHLMMPHEPLAFDSLGKRIKPLMEEDPVPAKQYDAAYLQYLVYTNNRMKSFIGELKEITNGNAIIMLMSDHGYRKNAVHGDWVYQTISAIYLPDTNYTAWYDGMSNVNQFRALFNSILGQKLPMLKDSLVR